MTATGLISNISTLQPQTPSTLNLVPRSFLTRMSAAAATHKTKQIGGSKNGESRAIPDHTQRAPKWYPADDIKQPKKSRKTPRPTKLRPSVPPPASICLLFDAGKS